MTQLDQDKNVSPTDVVESSPVALDNQHNLVLPPEAQGLNKHLIVIAQRYLSARRRQGQALLEAAQCLTEARTMADEGTWYLFLKVTATSHDVAERLLNIHIVATRDERFAEAVICGRLNQTVAGLLARPSTPARVRETLLDAPTAPRVVDVQRAIREIGSQQENSYQQQVMHVDNPHNAGQYRNEFYGPPPPAWLTPVCEQLARSRTTLLSIHGEVADLEDNAATTLAREIGHLLDSIEHISKALQQRRLAKKKS